MSVTLEDEDFETIQRTLKRANELCTHVIGGSEGMRNKAFEFAREYNVLKRRKVVPNK